MGESMMNGLIKVVVDPVSPYRGAPMRKKGLVPGSSGAH